MTKMARARILEILFCAGFVALIAIFFTFTAEDAWIVARYARNAVENGALVYNRGDYVNALTSPLDAMLRMPLHALSADPMLAHKLVAIALSAATLAIGIAVLKHQALARLLFLALTALSAPFAVWTVGGLETPLLALLVTAFTACLWAPRLRLYEAALLAGLAFLARHDSVLFTAPALLWAVRDQPFRRWIAGGLIAAVLPLAWLVFAFIYFHDPLPTSFHIKGPDLATLTLGYNAVYIADFLLQSGLVLAAVAAYALAQGRLIVPPLRRLVRTRIGLWVGVGATLAYGLLVATAHMMFSFRLFMPYLPVLAMLVSSLFASAGDGAANAPRFTFAAAAGIAALQAMLAYAMATSTLNPSRVGEYQYVGAGEYRTFIASLAQAADAIDSDWHTHSPEEPRPPRIATFAAGLLPWRLPQAYIFEDLVSWRRACFPDHRQNAALADYVHLMTPWFGTLAEQLPGPADRWETIWQRTELFDGERQTWMVVRNRNPEAGTLPIYVDGACRLPPLQLSQTR